MKLGDEKMKITIVYRRTIDKIKEKKWKKIQ